MNHYNCSKSAKYQDRCSPCNINPLKIYQLGVWSHPGYYPQSTNSYNFKPLKSQCLNPKRFISWGREPPFPRVLETFPGSFAFGSQMREASSVQFFSASAQKAPRYSARVPLVRVALTDPADCKEAGGSSVPGGREECTDRWAQAALAIIAWLLRWHSFNDIKLN